MSRFQDAVTIVTGGSTGLGRGLAREAARRGSNIVIASDSDAQETLEMLRELGVRAIFVETDVASYASLAAVREATIAEFGRVDFLINNAATGAGGGLDSVDPSAAHRLFEVNIGGVFNGIRVFADDLKASAAAGRAPAILNVGSEHSLGVPPHVMPLSVYTVAKYAVLGLTDTARRDFAQSGVSVSLLAPGWVLTERVRENIAASEDFKAAVEPYAQETDEVARIGLDGLEAGDRLIVTNPASVEFAMKAADGTIAELRKAAARRDDQGDPWAHDGSGDIGKCPVAGHLPGL